MSAASARQSLVKGERLTRNELAAVMAPEERALTPTPPRGGGRKLLLPRRFGPPAQKPLLGDPNLLELPPREGGGGEMPSRENGGLSSTGTSGSSSESRSGIVRDVAPPLPHL